MLVKLTDRLRELLLPNEKIEVVSIGSWCTEICNITEGLYEYGEVEECLETMTLSDEVRSDVAICPVFIWTNIRVFFVYEYDSMYWLVWVPRNPMQVDPYYCGLFDNEPFIENKVIDGG